MGDDLVWRWCPPGSLVLRCVSITDKGRVVSPDAIQVRHALDKFDSEERAAACRSGSAASSVSAR